MYDAKENKLDPVLGQDVRSSTGTQGFVKDAPIDLVYVADLGKTDRNSRAERDFYMAADVGFIAENVYLFCASEGLAVVARGSVDRPALSKVMNLRADQKILLAQTVGYPRSN